MGTWTTPIGVYVGQEVYGRVVVQAGHRRGWRIPEDVAIVAGKNEETLCERPRPTLTSIEIGYDRIGYAAADLLGRLMAGHVRPAEPIRLAPLGLVVRESTDFFAVDNPVVARRWRTSRRIATAASGRTTCPTRWARRRGRCKTTSARQSSGLSPPRSAASASNGRSGN